MRVRKWTIAVVLVPAIGAAAFFAGFQWHAGLTAAYEAPADPLAGAPPRDAASPGANKSTIDAVEIEGAMSREQIEQLTALGYLSAYVEATNEQGITVHDPDRAHRALNLYTSGHAPEAYLMDMEGAVLHTWRYAFKDLWPGPKPDGNIADFWRRAHLFENGDVIAIFETLGIFKVDKDSNLLWENRNSAHHDLFVHEDGRIFTLTQRLVTLDWFNGGRPAFDDFITVLSPEGEELQRLSILECLHNSPYAPLLQFPPKGGEVLHTNALKYLDGRLESRSSIFRRGNILVSIRELGVIAVVDLDKRSIVWALSGQWFRQHDPTLLDSGNIILFDNLGNAGMAKVLEVDPFTQEVVWAYGEGEAEALKSPVCGNVARLPNGNTLINEACRGRAFEVTPENEIVWEFRSPHRLANKKRLRATLLDFTRLPQSFSPAWLEP